ncbi:hypothetical protein RUM44_007095 [Polyplax serrata]|uniref:Uncharacterized protein n=1 Tax=Polyplax serrata TaxID=468196 RepID=A0ABR1AZR1_POLSC
MSDIEKEARLAKTRPNPHVTCHTAGPDTSSSPRGNNKKIRSKERNLVDVVPKRQSGAASSCATDLSPMTSQIIFCEISRYRRVTSLPLAHIFNCAFNDTLITCLLFHRLKILHLCPPPIIPSSFHQFFLFISATSGWTKSLAISPLAQADY